MPEENQERIKKLTNFTSAIQKMVATSDSAYLNQRYTSTYIPVYKLEEVKRIIARGTLEERRELSRAYYARGGIYKRVILQYATLLKYNGILIPNVYNGKISRFNSIYYEAIKYLDKMKLQSYCIEWTTEALTNGVFYGLILSKSKNDDFYVMKLPAAFCRSRFRDTKGRDIIEFNLNYFRTFVNQGTIEQVLKRFPKIVAKEWKRYEKKGGTDSWIFLPSDITICLSFLDGNPLFLDIIPAAINYEEAVETEKKRDLEEIKKIIVQKIPHLNTGELLFEPDEAESIHKGSVQMMKSNENVNVLTTYADVDAIVSKTSSDAVSDNLEKSRNNIFFEAGISKEIICSSSNLTIAYSIRNEIALMMTFANKISNFVTELINGFFGKKNITFSYKILPISYQNEKDYTDEALKMANTGYSLLIPAIAMDISQSQIIGLKDLENDFLKIGEKLLSVASIQKSEEDNGIDDVKRGAPVKAPEEKAPKTEQNEKSEDKKAGE